MTQRRGRARTKTTGSRRVRQAEDRQERLIQRSHQESTSTKQHGQAPCQNIYVPPTLEQGLQGRDDKAEHYQPYSFSDPESPRGADDEHVNPKGAAIRRVPSVIQDVGDDERKRSRRLRLGQHPDCDEEHSLPSSYHHSSSVNSPPRKKQSAKAFERPTRRQPDPPVKNDLRSVEVEQPQNLEYQTSPLSDPSLLSSVPSDEHRNPKETRPYERSLNDEFSFETGTFDSNGQATTSGDEEFASSRHNKQRRPFSIASVSTMASLESVTSMFDNDVSGPFAFLTSDLSGLVMAKQDIAICTMILSSVELLVLMLQLTMCGIAPFQTNMMVGPFPDAFSIWGGKNPYLMLVGNEWWRVLTPSLLSVGILHYAVNVYCLLGTGALFEREWGWMPWVYFLIVGSIGCSAFSIYFEPDTIAVGSSGTLLGLYGAKLAQIILQTFCQTPKKHVDEEQEEIIPLGYLGSVLFSLILQFVLGIFITYIDLAGSCGGLLTGLAAGLVYFSSVVDGCCWRFLISLFGLCALIGPVAALGYLAITETEPNEELADVCQYFRSLFTEEYECGCMG